MRGSRRRCRTILPMAVDRDDALDVGRAALAEGRWADAADAFERALQDGLDPDASFGLAIARWWLADNAQAMHGWAQAYVEYRRRKQAPAAVMAAFYLCLAYQMTYGNAAAARGWLGRAARVAAGADGAVAAGWVALGRAHLAVDDGRPGEAERWAHEALANASSRMDLDLELCAASELGAALIEQGRDQEGAALLDEAMAGAYGGEARDPDAVVLISCRTITAGSRAGDLRRVVEWVALADDFYRRYGSPHLYATCRAQYGAILVAAGRWSDAERELDHALRLSLGAEASVRAEALAALAELRQAQGRHSEVERLLAGYETHGSATVVLAQHHLSQGRARAAGTLLRRRLRQLEAGSISAARLQDLLVEAEVGAGRIDAAASAAASLASTASATRSTVIAARVAMAAGRVAMARGDRIEASEAFERAVESFERSGLPLESARARYLLGSTLASTDRESAIQELQAALAAFDRIGAADANAAAATLRSLGVRPVRGVVTTTGLLTRREREVLALLGEGLSNRQIADRLYITPKTAEHHVANVLAKTGLSGRAEAAAYAVRHLGAAIPGVAPRD